MESRLLIQRLKKLKPDAFSRFILYLKSPYFQRNESINKLADIIKPYYPEFIFSKDARSKLQSISPSDSAFNVLLSRINDLLDDFKLYEIYHQKSHLKKSLKHILELEHENNIQYYDELQIKEPEINSGSEELYALFFREFASITLSENNWIADKEKIFFHSDLAMKHILHYFLNKYLMVYANKITHALNMVDSVPESVETNVVLNFVKENPENLPLAVQCLYYVIQLYKSISFKNEAFDLYYENIKGNTFSLQGHEISNELQYVLLQTSTACIIKCYAEPDYIKKAFEIIEFLLKQDLYFVDQHDLIVQQRFILIVKTALGANEVEWATEFIKKEIGRVHKSSQQNLYNYALGLIYFNQQQYGEAVKLMVKININSPQFIIDYKITLLKMYYELNDQSSFSYQAQTFRKFLTKDRSLTKAFKYNIADSVEFIHLLFKYKKNKKKDEFEQKLNSKKLRYLVHEYRDKWYAEKMAKAFQT